TVPLRKVTVMLTPGRSMTTSSPACGTLPVLQLDGSSQKPSASAIHDTRAARAVEATVSSSTHNIPLRSAECGGRILQAPLQRTECGLRILLAPRPVISPPTPHVAVIFRNLHSAIGNQDDFAVRIPQFAIVSPPHPARGPFFDESGHSLLR